MITKYAKVCHDHLSVYARLVMLCRNDCLSLTFWQICHCYCTLIRMLKIGRGHALHISARHDLQAIQLIIVTEVATCYILLLRTVEDVICNSCCCFAVPTICMAVINLAKQAQSACCSLVTDKLDQLLSLVIAAVVCAACAAVHRVCSALLHCCR